MLSSHYSSELMIRKAGKKTPLLQFGFQRLCRKKNVHRDDPNSRNYNYVIPLAVVITSTSLVCTARRFDSSGSAPGSSSLSIVEEHEGSVEG